MLNTFILLTVVFNFGIVALLPVYVNKIVEHIPVTITKRKPFSSAIPTAYYHSPYRFRLIIIILYFNFFSPS